MDIDRLVVREGDRVAATGRLVRNDLGDWFEPALWVAEPGGLERRVRSVWRGAVRVTGVDFDAVAGRFEKDGMVEGWATIPVPGPVSSSGSNGRTCPSRRRRRMPGGCRPRGRRLSAGDDRACP